LCPLAERFSPFKFQSFSEEKVTRAPPWVRAERPCFSDVLCAVAVSVATVVAKIANNDNTTNLLS